MPQQITTPALPLLLVLTSLAGLGTAHLSAAPAEDWQCTDFREDDTIVRICKPVVTDHDNSAAGISAGQLEPEQNAAAQHGRPTTAAPIDAARQDAPATPSPGAPEPTTLPETPTSPAPPTTSESIPPPHRPAEAVLAPVTQQDECAAPMSATAARQISGERDAAFDLHNKLPLEAIADEVALHGNVAQFTGRVEFIRGDARLQAESASYNRESQIVELQQGVVATTPFARISGERGEISLANNASLIEKAEYSLLENGMFGSASSISIDPEQRVTIENGSYTRCPATRKIWEVRADKIKLNPHTGDGSAHDATLRIYDTPVLYVPYARFPIGDQRKSGLLFPRLSDTNDGLDFTQPYYFNLAPNMDATLSPRYTQNSGYLTEIELRWLNHFDQWRLGGAFIDNDENFGGSRWLLNLDEQGELDNGISSTVRFTKISDIDYLRDLDTTSLSVNRATHLEQYAELGYHHKLWSAGASLRQYQTLDSNLASTDKPFETSPELWVRYDSLPRLFEPGAHAQLRFASYDHEDLTDGERGYAQVELDFPMRWSGVSLQPAMGVQHLDYRLANSNSGVTTGNDDRSPSFTASYARLDLHANFDKPIIKAGRINAMHTLVPRLRYFYRDITDNRSAQQSTPLFDSDWLTTGKNTLYRDSRFSGYDIIEESNQLTASLTHQRYLAAGTQRLDLTLGQVIYFRDMPANGSTINLITDPASTTSRNSPLLGEFAWSSSRALSSNASVQWDSQQNRIEHGAFGLRWRSYANPARGPSVANLGYRYRKRNPDQLLLARNIEQLDASVVSGLSRRWGLFGRYQYDLTDSRSVESLAGVQYDDCCLQLRLVYRDGLIYDPDALTGSTALNTQRDRTIYLQIEFKGLAGVGRALENVLEESIFGYRAP